MSKTRFYLIFFSLGLILSLAACSAGAPSSTAPTTSANPTATTATSPVAAATTTTSAPVEAAPVGQTQTSAAITPVDNGKINLNAMTQDDLLNGIPNFSSRMVREFFEYQPYVSIQQFRREIGKYVGDEQVATYEQYVYVPVDVNNSDAATLMQIPGVDEAAAATLMAGRPYTTHADFLAKLGALISADQLGVAASYLAE